MRSGAPVSPDALQGTGSMPPPILFVVLGEA
jgi:hypothetical protein